MKRIKISCLLFICCLAVVSCQTKPAGAQQNQTEGLSNSSWELTSINNRQVITSSISEGVYITFEPNENRVSGFAGCNRFFGNYRLGESGELTFDAIGSTKMMCNNMAIETEFLNVLHKVNRYEQDGRTRAHGQHHKPKL